MADGGSQSETKGGTVLDIHNLTGSRAGPRAADLLAVVLSVLWLLGTAIFFIALGDGASAIYPLRFVLTLLVIFMPVAMIWVATTAMKSAAIVRAESERLQAAIDAMRKTYISHQHAVAGADPAVQKKLEEIAEAQKKTETALATFSTIRKAPPPKPAAPPQSAFGEGEQPALALPASPEDSRPPLDNGDFIAALQFPQTPDDTEGFRRLRRALQDRRAAQLITAAQDVLSLLSEDGIYMDDLDPDRARPETWRRFAEGERGRAVAALGGVRDRSSLALAAARMRKDMIFRDAAHHFLRRFDHIFAEWAPTASDTEIAALAETRTARAFMLLGRVTGTFD